MTGCKRWDKVKLALKLLIPGNIMIICSGIGSYLIHSGNVGPGAIVIGIGVIGYCISDTIIKN